MARIVCPYCFKEFTTNEVLCQCGNKGKKANGEDICERQSPSGPYLGMWGVNMPVPHIYKPKKSGFLGLGGVQIRGQKCDQCGDGNMTFVCPHCNNPLPNASVINGSEVISVIGGPAAGKTNYLVTLITMLRKHLGGYANITVTPSQVYPPHLLSDASTFNRFRDMSEQLFGDCMPLPKTPQGDAITKVPLIFEVSENKKDGKSLFLVFYDTAGENFDNMEEMKNNAKYFEHSKGIILLLDTLSVPDVKKCCNVTDNLTSIHTTIATLNNIFGDNDLGEKLGKTYVATILSKFDAVKENADKLNFDSEPFDAKNGFADTKKLDMSVIDSLSDLLKKEYLPNWEGAEVTGFMDRYFEGRHKYFPVSSFGKSVNERLEIEGGVDPWRVAEPFLWILKQMGFDIPTV